MSVAEVLRINDARFLAVAGELSAADWLAPSLCDEWTNHEVLAHLVDGFGARLGDVAAEMCRRRGSFNAANTYRAWVKATRCSPTELLVEFARLAGHPEGMGRYFPRTLFLGDHVTHELDIVGALDRPPNVVPEALTAVLNAQVMLPNPFVSAFRNSRGLRLVATDVDWAHGNTGPEVVGAAADLISVLANRPKAISRLDGRGVELLSARVLSRRTRTAS